MTLANFLSALDSKDILVTVLSIDGAEIIRFYAKASNEALDDALEARTVRKWEIKGATSISVSLNDAGDNI